MPTTWVKLDADGRVTGGGERVSDDYPIPEGATRVTGPLVAYLGRRWVADAWVVDPLPGLEPESEEDLATALKEQARLAALKEVHDLIQNARLRYITDLAGQDMVYLRKEEEAAAYLAAPDPDLDDYRFIRRDALRYGMTGAEAATQILFKAQLFTVLADLMEGVRGTAEDAITAATTPAAMRDAVEQAQADLATALAPYGG